MDEIVVVIPVHEYDQSIKEMLSRAIESIPTGKRVCITCTDEIKEKIEGDFKQALMFCTNAKSTSFQALINAAVKFLSKNNYKWFSILEFDDTYTPYWFGEAERYYSANPDVSIFMPLTHLVKEGKDENISFFGYGNEAPWASAFSNEIGFVDYEVLSNYFDFYLTGSIFNVDDFIYAGYLKESIKLVFWYEFLLRLTSKNKKVYVVPKVGYTHLVDRKNSLFDIYKSTLSEKEIEWWYDLAKQECHYLKDRNKTYEKENEEEE